MAEKTSESDRGGRLLSFQRRETDALYDVCVAVTTQYAYQVYAGSETEAIANASEAAVGMFPTSDAVVVKNVELA